VKNFIVTPDTTPNLQVQHYVLRSFCIVNKYNQIKLGK